MISNTNKLILGSQSPRRKEILSYFNIPFIQVSSDFDEESIPFKGNPKEYVTRLSKEKAQTIIENYPKAIILTADTIVFKNEKIYGKPKNEDEAVQFLQELSGNWHHVYTGLTLWVEGRFFHEMEETRVLFNALSDAQVQSYHHKLHFADKAGGYRIQGAGALAIRSIEGCYYNVMGLPINALYRILLNAGIDLWEHLKE